MVLLACLVLVYVLLGRDHITTHDSEDAMLARKQFFLPCLTNTVLIEAGTVRYGGLLRGRRTQHFLLESAEKSNLVSMVGDLIRRRHCGAFEGTIRGSSEAAPEIPWWLPRSNFHGCYGTCEFKDGNNTVLVHTFSIEQATNVLLYTRITMFK